MKLGQGRENAKTFLNENPEIMNQLEKEIRDNHAAKNADLESIKTSQSNSASTAKSDENQPAVGTAADS